MKRAVDTNVLVYAHVASVPEHDHARRFLEGELRTPGRTLVVTPGILHELIHVNQLVENPRRDDQRPPRRAELALQETTGVVVLGHGRDVCVHEHVRIDGPLHCLAWTSA